MSIIIKVSNDDRYPPRNSIIHPGDGIYSGGCHPGIPARRHGNLLEQGQRGGLRLNRSGGALGKDLEDNRIGIEPEYRERILRVFERLYGIETYPGTGIGLAIVRKGVERMRKRVGFESEVGKGSRFWIELPEAGREDEGRGTMDEGRGMKE